METEEMGFNTYTNIKWFSLNINTCVFVPYAFCTCKSVLSLFWIVFHGVLSVMSNTVLNTNPGVI